MTRHTDSDRESWRKRLFENGDREGDAEVLPGFSEEVEGCGTPIETEIDEDVLVAELEGDAE